ncbi:MAG: tRNA pseudouridine(38-40) synthase TruA [Acidobacteriia bacterium]|nr:tRNA pseudouridine(38-40) synthase TruA [Terriglobia bacterium]
MPRFRLYIEYQGTRYSGWQIQKNARSVQGEIQAAVARITGSAGFEFCGAGRTDAGVHALRQAAHLDVNTSLTPEILRLRLNDELPSDIHILALERAHPRFHARHHAVGRSYLYQISRRRTAFGKKLIWWVKEDLDVDGMRRAAALFVGMKNCQSFAADDPEEKSLKVLIDRVQLREAGDLILIRVEGSHFLWKMVRRIVGVLVEAGKGKLSIEAVARFLAVKSDEPARLAAPASGLFLERVYYAGDARLESLQPVMHIDS